MQLNILRHSTVSEEISTFICCENFKSYVLQLHMRFTLLYSYLHFMFSSHIVTKYNTGLLFWQLWVWSNETCTQIFGLNQILYLCERLNFGNVKSTRALHGLESVCKLSLPFASHYVGASISEIDILPLCRVAKIRKVNIACLEALHNIIFCFAIFSIKIDVLDLVCHTSILSA